MLPIHNTICTNAHRLGANEGVSFMQRLFLSATMKQRKKETMFVLLGRYPENRLQGCWGGILKTSYSVAGEVSRNPATVLLERYPESWLQCCWKVSWKLARVLLERHPESWLECCWRGILKAGYSVAGEASWKLATVLLERYPESWLQCCWRGILKAG